jgi:branched-chain amino acid transport system substrate-binding protein
MKKSTVVFSILALCALIFFGCAKKAETIKIGFNIPLTGNSPKIGEGSRYAGELVKKRINAAGGLQVGDKKYPLEFVYVDNELKPESAVQAATRLIDQDKVLAVVGPAGSGRANPAGQVNNDSRTPMISPWATNPAVTINRPYVFRACILDPVQATASVKFAKQTFPTVRRVAVLYNISDDYSKGLAEYFRNVWTTQGGTVSAFESFGEDDKEFAVQLTKIIASGAELLFLPAYYNHVGLIIPQAKNLGWGSKPVLGSDSWGSADLVSLSDGAVKGYYFTTHYAAAGATGSTKDFIDEYKAAYNYVPDEVAALSFDAINMILLAIQNAGLTGNLQNDRDNIRNAIASINGYPGITGNITFDANGDPDKEAVVVRVNSDGEFEFVTRLK